MIGHDKIFVIRNFRGTCTPVEMLKGYTVRERLVTPGLVNLTLSRALTSNRLRQGRTQGG